jgi:ABC-2 type transport system ATP-binding protein
VRRLVAAGSTVLLTTQYLEEADQLAGRICLIAAGRVAAEGTPEELKSRLGGDRIDVALRNDADLAAAAELIGKVTGGTPEVNVDTRRLSAPVRERIGALTETVRALDDAGIVAEDIALRRPTLDEVFLQMTQEVAA